MGGTSVSNDDLLSEISVLQSGSVIRKYILSHGDSPTTGAKLLTSLKECSDAAGSNCLPPTAFVYQGGQIGVATSATFTMGNSVTEVRAHLDFNGDGLGDIAYRGSSGWIIAFGSVSNGFVTHATSSSQWIRTGDASGTGRDSFLVAEGGVWVAYTWKPAAGTFVSASTGLSANAGYQVSLADANGDGKKDLIYLDVSYQNLSINLYVRPSIGENGAVLFGPATVTSIDKGAAGMQTVPLIGHDLALGSPRRMDFNGDGRDDFVLGINYCVPTGFGCTPFSLGYVLSARDSFHYELGSQLWQFNAATQIRLHFLDWNADDCTDLMIDSSVTLSNCKDSFAGSISVPANAGGFDWNGDGRADLVQGTGTTTSVSLSTGVGLTSPTIFSTVLGSNCNILGVDYDGDGQEDLLCWIQGGTISVYRHNSPAALPDLLTSVADGFGNQQYVQYAPTTSSIHVPGDALTEGWTSSQRPQYVVQTLTSPDGIGGTYTRSYAYWGQAFNLRGRGFAGFAQLRETDSRTGAMLFQRFETYFPYTGMLKEAEAQQGSGTRIAWTSHVHSSKNPVGVPAAYFPFTATSTSLEYQVGGADGALLKESQASFTYDSWGNQTGVTRTVYDRSATSEFNGYSWTQTVSSTYTPDTSGNWCLGLPLAVAASFSGTNEVGVSRSKTFTVDSARCRHTGEVTEPNSTSHRVAKVFAFDPSFGNLTSVSVVGRDMGGQDMAARITTLGWDSTGRFLETVIDALGQSTTRTYDHRFGVVTGETDANLVSIGSAYDSFGRLERINNADGTATSFERMPCGQSPVGCQVAVPWSAATSINAYAIRVARRDSSPSHTVISDSWEFRDTFDRPIVERESRLDGSYTRLGVEYDALGRIARQLIPCHDANCAAYWVTTTYDLLGRPLTSSRKVSEGLGSDRITGFQYSGFTEVVTDAQGKISYRTFDAAGRVRHIRDMANYGQNFGYDAFGSLVQVTDTLSNTLFTASYSYGLEPFQTTTDSPMDLGLRTYSYNALGELRAWTDAKSQSFTQTFDAIGRLTTRTELEGVTTWNWGTSSAAKNIGRLASITSPGFGETYAYDSIGRLTSKQTFTDSQYGIDYTYDSATGQLDTLTYPQSTSSYRVKLKYEYQNGQLRRIRDFNSALVYWQADATTPRGQVSQETLGNGIVTRRSYDLVSGLLSNVQAGVGGGQALQNESYLYDLVGNVTQRANNSTGLTENFFYDDLYRLDHSTLSNGSTTGTNLQLHYDALGNITSRSDIANGATWVYHPTKKYAVTQAGSSAYTYSYDANGNATTRHGNGIGWSSYNYPVQINGAEKSLMFFYGPDRQRFKQVYSSSGVVETTMYVGGLLEKVTSGSMVDYRHYIKVGSRAIAILSRKSDGTNATRYVLEDHQGSPARITEADGSSYVQESFSAFGARRDAGTWADSCLCDDLAKIKNVSRHGYTGHEAIGGVSMGLNHMNGRVQDAITGRFLSADATIPNPFVTQSYNRYSYVDNNPLSLIDPSGFSGSTAACNDDIGADGCFFDVDGKAPPRTGGYGFGFSVSGTTSVSSVPWTPESMLAAFNEAMARYGDLLKAPELPSSNARKEDDAEDAGTPSPQGMETTVACRSVQDSMAQLFGAKHCFTVIHYEDANGNSAIYRQYSLAGMRTFFPQDSFDKPTFQLDRQEWLSGSGDRFSPTHRGTTDLQFSLSVIKAAEAYNSGRDYSANGFTGPNSNTATDTIIRNAGGSLPVIPGAYGQTYNWPPYSPLVPVRP